MFTAAEADVTLYNVIKFLHILSVTITIGGMFARQLVRALARKSGDVHAVASLTQAAVRIDRTLVIPLHSRNPAAQADAVPVLRTVAARARRVPRTVD